MFAYVQFIDDLRKCVVPASDIKGFDLASWKVKKFMVKWREGGEEEMYQARILRVAGE
jgi:hypothetical protein